MSNDVGDDGEGKEVSCDGVWGVKVMVWERAAMAFSPNAFGKSCGLSAYFLQYSSHVAAVSSLNRMGRSFVLEVMGSSGIVYSTPLSTSMMCVGYARMAASFSAWKSQPMKEVCRFMERRVTFSRAGTKSATRRFRETPSRASTCCLLSPRVTVGVCVLVSENKWSSEKRDRFPVMWWVEPLSGMAVFGEKEGWVDRSGRSFGTVIL